ncbi:MAG: molecular chaperone [Terriglobia bacterium]
MEKPDMKDLAVQARERSNIYGFLSLVYGEEPSAGFVREVRVDDFASVLQELGVVFDAIFDTDDQEQLLERLAVEYNRLYVGPGHHIPPYESVYTTRNGQSKGGKQEFGTMQGKAARDVSRALDKLGLKLSKKFKGMSDHIATELAMMRFLAEEESDSWDQGDAAKAQTLLEVQNKFLKDHLARWAPEFCDRASEYAELKFYETLANLTKEFVLSERETIPRLMGTARA